MEVISVAALAARRALVTFEFRGHIVLTGQLPRVGLPVSQAGCRDSWRVFHISNLLC